MMRRLPLATINIAGWSVVTPAGDGKLASVPALPSTCAGPPRSSRSRFERVGTLYRPHLKAPLTCKRRGRDCKHRLDDACLGCRVCLDSYLLGNFSLWMETSVLNHYQHKRARLQRSLNTNDFQNTMPAAALRISRQLMRYIAKRVRSISGARVLMACRVSSCLVW